MPASTQNQLAKIIDAQERQILQDWHVMLKESESVHGGRLKEAELQTQSRSLLALLQAALKGGSVDAHDDAYDSVRAMLSDISRSRAIQGFSSGETARFIFSLKKPIFKAVRVSEKDPASAADRVWEISILLDELGLYTMEVYQKNREEVIARQQSEISELSTPVVKLWEGVLALPLIGTLDSARTQVVMENLLQSIVDYGAEIAIIDITGVPTVDTLVAQHLLKTVAAARLMGADCIVSGIRPQIAQTMVHLGVDLDVVTKSSLADAFSVALRRTGRAVVDKTAADSLSSGT